MKGKLPEPSLLLTEASIRRVETPGNAFAQHANAIGVEADFYPTRPTALRALREPLIRILPSRARVGQDGVLGNPRLPTPIALVWYNKPTFSKHPFRSQHFPSNYSYSFCLPRLGTNL